MIKKRLTFVCEECGSSFMPFGNTEQECRNNMNWQHCKYCGGELELKEEK